MEHILLIFMTRSNLIYHATLRVDKSFIKKKSINSETNIFECSRTPRAASIIGYYSNSIDVDVGVKETALQWCRIIYRFIHAWWDYRAIDYDALLCVTFSRHVFPDEYNLPLWIISLTCVNVLAMLFRYSCTPFTSGHSGYMRLDRDIERYKNKWKKFQLAEPILLWRLEIHNFR